MIKIFIINLFFFFSIYAESPNFILILSDDQSWKGSSVEMDPENPLSKSDFYKTPNLEKLSQSGMRFTNGYSPGSTCCPTRRSILIGQIPARHIHNNDQQGWTEYYKKQLSIPQLLKTINPQYKTAHLGKWDLRFDEVTPEEMGYDVSDGATGNGEGGSKGSGGPNAKKDPKLIDDLTNRAGKFLELCKNENRPFYLQISHYAVHLDIYYKKKTLEAVKKREKGQLHQYSEFAAMTEDLDDGVGVLMKKLKKLGLTKSTYVIYMSDNGGRTRLPGNDAKELNDPLRSGKGTLYEGGIRVPFMISGPGIKENSISHVPVTGVDFLPTIADLAGKAFLEPSIDGGSLKNILFEDSDVVKRNKDYLFFHQALDRIPMSVIRQGNYKLIKTWSHNKLELFNLKNDLNEMVDLSREMPGKKRDLLEKMNRMIDELSPSHEYLKES